MGGYSYLSAFQSADGSIHVTYSPALPRTAEDERRETIRHVRFSEDWLMDKGSPSGAE
jgi:hypothetical protein